jgi:hypothetical protein
MTSAGKGRQDFAGVRLEEKYWGFSMPIGESALMAGFEKRAAQIAMD